MARSKLTIIVSGMLAGVPHQGGATWAVLQYVLGLRRLGHDVYVVEPLEERALRPASVPLERSEQARYFRQVVAEFGLADRAALLLAGTRQTDGLPYERLLGVARRADLLLNIAGMLTDELLSSAPPLRVYLDFDPAFTQLWSAAQGIDMRFAGHTHFVTVGLAIGGPDCPVPLCGLNWIPTPQPIVLERWPVAGEIARDAFTTVANWRGYGSIEHEGVFYGQKAHSLRPYFALPALADGPFVLALAIHPEERNDLAALERNGWRLVDPLTVARSPSSYRKFVQGSLAEFTVAKSGYVAARCGWFSDRSVCYLASGRPVVAQETGFSRFLPAGAGLLAFTTLDEAREGIAAVRQDYPHRRAARALAEAHFDSDTVLARLLSHIS